MASTFTCRLKLGGRLADPPEANKNEIAMFARVVGSPPPHEGDEGEKWPLGFLPKAFKVNHWIAEGSVGGPKQDQTVLSFLAEVSLVVPGQLYDTREPFIQYFARFLSYRHMPWHKDLREQVVDFNMLLADKLIDRVWFKELSIFADNGGDS
jgi:hypothetical protein